MILTQLRHLKTNSFFCYHSLNLKFFSFSELRQLLNSVKNLPPEGRKLIKLSNFLRRLAVNIHFSLKKKKSREQMAPLKLFLKLCQTEEKGRNIFENTFQQNKISFYLFGRVTDETQLSKLLCRLFRLFYEMQLFLRCRILYPYSNSGIIIQSVIF